MQNPRRDNLRTLPTCPSVLIPFQQRLYALPLLELSVNVEIHVATAFVKVKGVWRNVAKYKTDCMVCLPTKGTVTDVRVGLQNRRMATAIIPRSELQHLGVDLESAKPMATADDPKKASSKPPQDPSHPQAAEPELAEGELPPNAYHEYIPDLFRLPIAGVNSKDLITAEITFVETLPFINGAYEYRLPLVLAKTLLANGKDFNDVLKLECTIHCATEQDLVFESPSHRLRQLESGYPRVRLAVETFSERPASPAGAAAAEAKEASPADDKSWDFLLRYRISANSILPTVVLPPKQTEIQEGGGNFLLFVTPPSLDGGLPQSRVVLPRKVIFLLDRSGSMAGRPYREAVRALLASLDQLGPQDSFGVCAFDHRQAAFNEGRLVHATPANRGLAKAWAKMVLPEGGSTDIATPLMAALDLLEAGEEGPGQPPQQQKNGKKAGTPLFRDAISEDDVAVLPGPRGNRQQQQQQTMMEVPSDAYEEPLERDDLQLPILLLLTDGCVQNERALCHSLHERVRRTRVLTFGIGTFCNWYFLRMLAQIGRGFSDVSLYSEHIFRQMTHLLGRVRAPVLTDIQVVIPGSTSGSALDDSRPLPVVSGGAAEQPGAMVGSAEASPPNPELAAEALLRHQRSSAAAGHDEAKAGGVSSHEMYPHPVPDLFMGSPLTVSGRYQGRFPDFVLLRGRLVGGQAFETRVPVRRSDVIPIGKVFLKQRMDLLTARAWLQQDDALEEEVVALSCGENMPSPYTVMVAYEAPPGASGDEDESKDSPHGDILRKYRSAEAGKPWYRNPAALAGLGVGSVAVVGAMSFSFGDVGASADNLSVFGDAIVGGGAEVVSCCGGVWGMIGECIAC